MGHFGDAKKSSYLSIIYYITLIKILHTSLSQNQSSRSAIETSVSVSANFIITLAHWTSALNPEWVVLPISRSIMFCVNNCNIPRVTRCG